MRPERLTDRMTLRLCGLAAFLVMLPAVWLVLRFTSGLWQLFLLLLVGLADLFLMTRLSIRLALPKVPAEAQAAALPAATLLSGDLRVSAMMAPEVRMDPDSIRPGSSMLLCAHAAALLSPGTGMAQEAIRLGLERLRVVPEQVARRMPMTGTMEAHGLRWQLHQDGKGTRAFTWGTCGQILPVCAAMISRRPLPLSPTLRAKLVEQLMAERLPPVCLAMAEVTPEGLGEPTYLGAFLFEEALASDALQEVNELRRRGLRPFVVDDDPELAAAVNRRLGCDAAPPSQAYRFNPSEPRDRLSRVLRLYDARKSRMMLYLIQTSTML